ncbi:hypothetical protein ES702_06794 [subsurface metagenome]
MAEQKKEIKIKISDDMLMGRYANYMRVSHTAEEFVLEFANIMGPTGSVVAKVFTSPRHLKRIMKALQGSIKRYEDKHSTIKEAEEPKVNIGF